MFIGTIIISGETAFATPVSVRLEDQIGVEHTLGQLCVSGVGCATSGGTIDLTIGDTVSFQLIPSASNSRLGEQSIASSLLSRTDVRVVSGTSMVFTWDRVLWNPIDLVDQNGLRHTKGTR